MAGAGRFSPWPRRFLRRVAIILGADIRVVGTPLRRDAMIAANHLSWMDILLLAGTSGTRFVAKAEVASQPLIGWLASLNRTLFVERGDRLGVGDQVATIRAALTEGQPLAVFPEGTTGDDLGLLPFKPALFAALVPPLPGIRCSRCGSTMERRRPIWPGSAPIRVMPMSNGCCGGGAGSPSRSIIWSPSTLPTSPTARRSRRRPGGGSSCPEIGHRLAGSAR